MQSTSDKPRPTSDVNNKYSLLSYLPGYQLVPVVQHQ